MRVRGRSHYFSALATHLANVRPDVVARHRVYLEALRTTGADVTLAKFKRKVRVRSLQDFRVQVRPSRRWFTPPIRFVRLSQVSHEEKETKVAHRHFRISAQLYRGHQFPVAVLTAGGQAIRKPATW